MMTMEATDRYIDESLPRGSHEYTDCGRICSVHSSEIGRACVCVCIYQHRAWVIQCKIDICDLF